MKHQRPSIPLPPRTKHIARAAFALYLVAALSAGETGYWLFALLNLRAIQHEISEVIREQCSGSELSEISFADGSPALAERVWTEMGKEFCYREEMYDVVDSVRNEHSTTYRCFRDNEETGFRRIVSRHAGGDDIGSPSIRTADLKTAKNYTEPRITAPRITADALNIPAPYTLYQSPIPDRRTPPPKFS